MLPGVLMLPLTLGCRSPRAALKHTHPHLSDPCGLPLCFNALSGLR